MTMFCRAQFKLGQGILDKGVFSSGKWFADTACQIKGGRTGGDDTDAGDMVYDQLQVDADVLYFLGFINNQQPVVAHKVLQFFNGLRGEVALNGYILSAHQQIRF